MFLLAHLSDPHIGPMPMPRLRELINKRGLGLINWYRKRHRHHRAVVLDAIVADMTAQAPDHVAPDRTFHGNRSARRRTARAPGGDFGRARARTGVSRRADPSSAGSHAQSLYEAADRCAAPSCAARRAWRGASIARPRP